MLMTLCLLAFSSLGGFIYYNTNVLNTHYTLLDLQQLQAEYETSYKTHQDLPQPEIDSVSVDVAIYPAEREAEIKGTYKLTNYKLTNYTTLVGSPQQAPLL